MNIRGGKGQICLALGIFLIISLLNSVSAQDDFEVNSLLLKVSVTEGATLEKSFEILSNSGGDFRIEINGLKNVGLSETSFVLQKGEKKNIVLSFDSYGLKDGVYVGNIKITSGGTIDYIPVILEVESVDVFFDVNLDVAPQYNTISPGDSLIAQLKVFDLVSGGVKDGLGVSTVNLEYYVYDIDGNVIISETESVVVDGQNQFTKTISFPTDIKEGEYVFSSVVKYASSVGVSSYLFSIQKKGLGEGFFGIGDGGTDINFLAVLFVIVIVFIVLVLLFVYLIKDKNKLVSELEKHNTLELQQQKQILMAQVNHLKKKGVSTKRVKKAIAHKIKVLRKKHKERVQKFKKLKKAGKTDEMKKALNEWKKQGYYTLEMNSRLGELSASEMKKVMADWKRGKK